MRSRRYQRIPVEVDAVQFFEGDFDDILEWTWGALNYPIEDGEPYQLETPYGLVYVRESDYIVKVGGYEHYVLTERHFNKNYRRSI